MTLAGAPPAEGLVDRAAGLVPMLRETAQATENARRLPPEHFDALAEIGVLRMMVPKRYGGYEADFQTQCDTLAMIARGCPSELVGGDDTQRHGLARGRVSGRGAGRGLRIG